MKLAVHDATTGMHENAEIVKAIIKEHNYRAYSTTQTLNDVNRRSLTMRLVLSISPDIAHCT